MIDIMGVIGLWNMGEAIAANLAADGLEVVGYDPDPEAATRFTGIGGHLMGSPGEAAEIAHVVIASVASSIALQHAISAEHDHY